MKLAIMQDVRHVRAQALAGAPLSYTGNNDDASP